MKKALYLLLILSIVACKKEETLADFMILSGTITNKNGDTLILSNKTYTKKIQVSPDGSFRDTITVETGMHTLLQGAEYANIYLKNGYDLNLQLDTKQFDETLKYSGLGAENNNYIISKFINEEGSIDFYKLYALEENEFLDSINEIKKSRLDFLEKAKLTDDEFVKHETKNLNYDYLKYIINYENYHRYLTENPEFNASKSILSKLENMNYANEEDYTFSESYRTILATYYSKQAEELAEKDSIEFGIAYLKILNKIPNEIIKNNMLYDSAISEISFTNDIEGYYSAFIEGSTNEEHKKEITKSYDKLRFVANGKPSPSFKNYRNYAGGTTSLSDLKGSYVYIDVWATWCGPCIAQIPSLKEVEKKYHNKNITFVSISIDNSKDYDKWVNMVEEKKLSGIQLIADNAWQSKFVQDYMIVGIPRFILLNPDGKIVNSNAPWPSSDNLIKLFNELNI